MLKMIGLLRRRPGLSPEAFQVYWRERHALLGQRLPGLRGYVQNHTRLSVYRSRQPAYDGVAELWFDDLEAFQGILGSPELQTAREDERNFIDHSRSILIITEEKPVVE